MHNDLQPPRGYWLAGRALADVLTRIPRWLRQQPTPQAATEIPTDFLGVNVAPGRSTEIDDYTLAQLRDLGITRVRMDMSYCGMPGSAQQLLDRLLAEGHQVMLNVFPPREVAAQLHRDAAAQQRWRDFLESVFTAYAGRVALFEVGNTPNRGKWSGFSARSFLQAWSIAVTVAEGHEVQLAGPNVSDFEPLYSAVFLKLMASLGRGPDTHTNNLFVERVVEPEAYDHRVLGRLFTRIARINLIKKARILRDIGAEQQCPELISTYTCWTNKRLARRNRQPKLKAADYLVRYLCLAASSGALRHIYWGPLICNRDGLIDDAATDYPAVDQVSFYQQVRGQLEDFQPTPARSALRYWWQRCQGAQLSVLHHDSDMLTAVALEKPGDKVYLLLWCRDAISLPLQPICQQFSASPTAAYDTLGNSVPLPEAINEHPIYLELSGTALASNPRYQQHWREVSHQAGPDWQGFNYANTQWHGAVALRSNSQHEDHASLTQILPGALLALPELAVLRDVRNRLWNVSDPRGVVDTITVKLNRVKGIKRITYRLRPSKGRRHWNNANQMLRRGIATPAPLGFFEAPEQAGISDSYYLCEFMPEAFSARDVYAAFRDGANQYRGLDKSAWFQLLAQFVCLVHDKQIIHRDLSAGNLLLRENENGIQPMLIDIGRAWIWSGPGSRVRRRHRLVDLIRICYKLDWADRELFVRQYELSFGHSLGGWWRLPFYYYDTKQGLKKRLKGKRRRRTKRL